MTTTLPPGSPLRSILKKPGTPPSDRKRNVEFQSNVKVIGENDAIPLLPPHENELDFDVNPQTANWSGRAGTMRIKGAKIPVVSAATNTKAQSNTTNSASSNQSTIPSEPRIIEGHLKLLKETGMKASWMKRYIVLTNTKLSYYRGADNDVPLKSFPITSDTYVKEISSRSGVDDCSNSIEIVYERGKNIILKGSSRKEATEWMTSIVAVIDSIGRSNNYDSEDDYEFIEDNGDDEPFKDVSSNDRERTEKAPFSTPISAVSTASNDSDEDIEWWDEDDDETVDIPSVSKTKTSIVTPASSSTNSPTPVTKSPIISETKTTVATVHSSVSANTSTVPSTTIENTPTKPSTTTTATTTTTITTTSTSTQKPTSPVVPNNTARTPTNSRPQPKPSSPYGKRAGYTPTVRVPKNRPATTFAPPVTKSTVEIEKPVTGGKVSNLMKLWEGK